MFTVTNLLRIATLGCFAVQVFAAEPSSEVSADLRFDEAERLALQDQPLLEALEFRTRAARDLAVAARQLPDPQLVAGVVDLPVDTGEAGSLSRDSDTQMQVGFLQEFPRSAKRQLRGAASDRRADTFDAERHLTEREIRRDVSLSWLELWRSEQALQLVHAMQRETDVQLHAVEIALKANRSSQAEMLAARVESAREDDRVAAAEQEVYHARSLLSRWIADAANRPVCPDLPATPILPPLDVVLARVRAHPRLTGLRAQVAQAQIDADLVQASYSPDWRIELAYSHRQDYAEEMTLKVGIDLPVFTRNRQDRGLAAALAQKDAADDAVEDGLRQLEAEVRLNHHDWLHLTERLHDYDSILLPQSQAGVEAAIASWRSGQFGLAQVLEARRSALEIRMARLELQTDAVKHFIQLRFLGAYDAAAVDPVNGHE